MVEKPYLWTKGAVLEEHSVRKHKILREYFARYLAVRCKLPKQERFRLAVVDGFAGGGRYEGGAPGSPIIFIEELKQASEAFNLYRASEGMPLLTIECLLIFNDLNRDAIEVLKSNLAPLLAEIAETAPKLRLTVEYRSKAFEKVYPEIKNLLNANRLQNVIFNLDQCGSSRVDRDTIADVMKSFGSAEIFYTFGIKSLLAFLQKADPERLRAQLKFLGLKADDVVPLTGLINNGTRLGAAENIVFASFQNCAPYVSPFSIHNPEGWRYWLIHFANSYRARQEYNNVLHRNSSMQAHYGRSGLNMLSYNPALENSELYLFEKDDRKKAEEQLFDDIPRLISGFGDTVRMQELYEVVYKMTPAHADDIHSVMIKNPDVEVLTEAGGFRKKSNTITSRDFIRLKDQKSFFPLFGDPIRKKE